MNAFCLLALLLPPPDLESHFVGCVPDTNGNLVHLEVKTRSTCGIGGRITRQVNVESAPTFLGNVGLEAKWTFEDGSFSGGVPLICGSEHGVRRVTVQDGFVSVFRGDALIFRMYAPAYGAR